jgi:O-acetyl-ADP-ribose deacetylase
MGNIQVKFGNLIQEEADFIVNASNTELALGSGVSMAFRKHCSQNYPYQEELNKLAENNASVLEGSATNFKYALHAAIMNYTDKTISKKSSYDEIQKSLENIINIVNNCSINNPKVAIPLLGCGVGGLDKENVFTMICNNFENQHFNVVIYLYDLVDKN